LRRYTERANMDVERVLQRLQSLVRSDAGDMRHTFGTAAGGRLTYEQVLGVVRPLMPASASASVGQYELNL
jgi:hypothetical protein